MSDPSIWLSHAISFLALVLSAYAVVITLKFNKRQLTLIESQELLNKRLLEQGDVEAIAARKADVAATIVKLGSSKYRVRVFNKGKSTARNVTIELPDDHDLVIDSDVKSKFPMEVLDPQQSVELIAAVHMGTPSKHTAIVKWADDYSGSNEKTVYLTI